MVYIGEGKTGQEKKARKTVKLSKLGADQDPCLKNTRGEERSIESKGPKEKKGKEETGQKDKERLLACIRVVARRALKKNGKKEKNWTPRRRLRGRKGPGGKKGGYCFNETQIC